MFTGIITDLGEVTAIAPLPSGVQLVLRTAYDLAAIPLGASIAHDGACLTVVAKDEAAGCYMVEVSTETLAKTTIGQWKTGTKVNLERPLAVGGEYGGHMVTGHVDGLGEVARFEPQGAFWLLDIAFPDAMRGMIAPKGSVAVNGVSLTVNAVAENVLSITLIPHTAEVTNLGRLQRGDKVNLEIDLIARYVAQYLSQRQTA